MRIIIDVVQAELKRHIQREIVKFGISLWHIDKHGVLLTAREKERERERERKRKRNIYIYIFKSFIYWRERERERERESEREEGIMN